MTIVQFAFTLGVVAIPAQFALGWHWGVWPGLIGVSVWTAVCLIVIYIADAIRSR